MYKLIKLAQNKLFVVAMMLVVSAVFIAPAFAGEEGSAGGSAGGSKKTDVFGINVIEGENDKGESIALGTGDFTVTITRIINIALSLLGIVAVVIILVAGFKWMTAGGNDEKVGEARKMLFAGVIGLAIIMSAWAIAKFVLVKLGTATNVTGIEDYDL